MKICIKCNTQKSLNDFHKKTVSKDGFNNTCKKCACDYRQSKRKENPEKTKQYDSEYRAKNREKINKNVLNYNNRNKDKIKEKKKEFNKNNKDKINATRRIYRNKNKEKINEKVRNYFNKKCKTDELFRLKQNIRNLVKYSLKNKGVKKESKTINILGCSFEEFKNYLESKFENWMTWENYGKYNGKPKFGWDIDHIIPMSSGKDEKTILALNQYTNLQPLCSYINRVTKKDKF